MYDIKNIYGKEMEVGEEAKVTEPKVQTTITVRDKEVQREKPMGAIVLNETVDIMVEEIENGWIKTVNRYCNFKTVNEEGEENHDSYYSTKRYYSKNKPVDIELTYAV